MFLRASNQTLTQRKSRLPRKRLRTRIAAENNCEQPEKTNEPASRSGDRDGETSPIVADELVVDAQEERPRPTYGEGLAGADKE